jgi:thioredoxin 1
MSKYTHEITDNNFQEEVIKSDKPVLIDFWAQWCGPCLALGPTIDTIAEEYDGKLKVGKVNVDQNSSIAAKYGIRSIPSLLIFSNGKVEEQLIGAVPKEQIIEKLKHLI